VAGNNVTSPDAAQYGELPRQL